MLRYAALTGKFEQLIPLNHNMLGKSWGPGTGLNPSCQSGSSPPRPFSPFLHSSRTSRETDILRWKVGRLLDDLAEIEPSAFLAVCSNRDGNHVAASTLAFDRL